MSGHSSFTFANPFTSGFFRRLGYVPETDTGKPVLREDFIPYYLRSIEDHASWMIVIDRALRTGDRKIWRGVEKTTSHNPRRQIESNAESIRLFTDIDVLSVYRKLVQLFGRQYLEFPAYRTNQARDYLRACYQKSKKDLTEFSDAALNQILTCSCSINFLRDWIFGWKSDNNFLALVPTLLSKRLDYQKSCPNTDGKKSFDNWLLASLLAFGISIDIYPKEDLPLVLEVFNHEIQRITSRLLIPAGYNISPTALSKNLSYWTPICVAAFEETNAVETYRDPEYLRIFVSRIKEDQSGIVLAYLFSPEGELNEYQLREFLERIDKSDLESYLKMLLTQLRTDKVYKRVQKLCEILDLHFHKILNALFLKGALSCAEVSMLLEENKELVDLFISEMLEYYENDEFDLGDKYLAVLDKKQLKDLFASTNSVNLCIVKRLLKEHGLTHMSAKGYDLVIWVGIDQKEKFRNFVFKVVSDEDLAEFIRVGVLAKPTREKIVLRYPQLVKVGYRSLSDDSLMNYIFQIEEKITAHERSYVVDRIGGNLECFCKNAPSHLSSKLTRVLFGKLSIEQIKVAVVEKGIWHDSFAGDFKAAVALAGVDVVLVQQIKVQTAPMNMWQQIVVAQLPADLSFDFFRTRIMNGELTSENFAKVQRRTDEELAYLIVANILERLTAERTKENYGLLKFLDEYAVYNPEAVRDGYSMSEHNSQDPRLKNYPTLQKVLGG